jgi:hypothetical protein
MKNNLNEKKKKIDQKNFKNPEKTKCLKKKTFLKFKDLEIEIKKNLKKDLKESKSIPPPNH